MGSDLPILGCVVTIYSCRLEVQQKEKPCDSVFFTLPYLSRYAVMHSGHKDAPAPFLIFSKHQKLVLSMTDELSLHSDSLPPPPPLFFSSRLGGRTCSPVVLSLPLAVQLQLSVHHIRPQGTGLGSVIPIPDQMC